MVMALPIMLLAARPDMSQAIRVVCVFLFVFFSSFALMFLFFFVSTAERGRLTSNDVSLLFGFIFQAAAAGTHG